MQLSQNGAGLVPKVVSMSWVRQVLPENVSGYVCGKHTSFLFSRVLRAYVCGDTQACPSRECFKCACWKYTSEVSLAALA